ncbi:MAG TPA: tol-pal system protein YbgF [Rudaea sp.]|nr:tol-pal system protein YbgF [Rudaea sp.]
MSSIALRTTDGLTKASRMSVHAIFSKQISINPIRFICAAALLAAVAFSVPAQAQRMSLAERVTKLEQDQAGQNGAQANIDLVNQINALQSQVQTLQGQIEELRHQVDETKSRNKEQYIDLDSRLARLEGRGGPAPAAAGAAGGNNGQLQDITLGATPAAPPPGAAVAPRAPAGAPPPNVAPPPAAAAADAAPTANAGDEKADYDQAFSALKDGRYAESARRFQAFIGQYPNSELTPNSYYWLGESYYVTQNYPISLDTFQKLLAQYPNSQKAPDALLKVGYCEYEMKKWDQAEATLNQVVQKYPDTTVARLAQGRLRALKLEARH